MIHFSFLLQMFFQPEYLGTMQARWLKFFKDVEAYDRGINFQKMQNF